MPSKRKYSDFSTANTPAGRISPVRIRGTLTDLQIEKQRARDIELLRGARETYHDGTSRAFPIREDEGGWDNE
jgi:hypothetical protein